MALAVTQVPGQRKYALECFQEAGGLLNAMLLVANLEIDTTESSAYLQSTHSSAPHDYSQEQAVNRGPLLEAWLNFVANDEELSRGTHGGEGGCLVLLLPRCP